MCTQCRDKMPNPDENGYAEIDIYDEPHPWLPDGMTRSEYFRGIASQLNMAIGLIAMCPAKSDDWLSGGDDLIVNRFGVNAAPAVPATAAALFDEPLEGEHPFAYAADGLRDLLLAMANNHEFVEKWHAGAVHLIVDKRGAAFKETGTGLPLGDEDLPGMYL